MLTFTNVMLGSEHPKELSAFYTEVLGEPTWEDGGYVGWQLGGGGIMIGSHSEVKGRSTAPARIILNLQTPEFREEFERIKGLGAVVVAEPYQPGGPDAGDFWVATFEDADGNYFQIGSPIPEM